jgi:octaprenyl-diphosphate synthase
MQFDSIKTLVANDFQAVDALINASLHSKVSVINDLGRYITHNKGKRLRPLIVLLIAKATGYTGKQHIGIATTIELIHTATLLHDDVVDNADQRRGQKTANHVFGNEAAVLVGDFLYTKAFQSMTQNATTAMMEILANATNIMAEGEVLQLMERFNPEMTEGSYLNVIQYKTAKLFETAALLAALLGETSSLQQKAMARFGNHLGTAFQLIDDILDYQGDPAKTGKDEGRDLSEGKVTLPLIYVLQNGSPTEISLVQQAIKDGNREYFPEILRIIETSGALQYTMQLARSEANRARKELDSLTDSE